jgi:hypothetical protein
MRYAPLLLLAACSAPDSYAVSTYREWGGIEGVDDRGSDYDTNNVGLMGTITWAPPPAMQAPRRVILEEDDGTHIHPEDPPSPKKGEDPWTAILGSIAAAIALYVGVLYRDFLTGFFKKKPSEDCDE